MHAPVGQRMHHLEGCRATIDDDRVTVFAKLGCSACNRLFFFDPDSLVDRECSTCQSDELRRSDGFRPTPYTAQFFLHVQCCDVTTNGGFRRSCQPAQVDDARERAILNRGQDNRMAFCFVQIRLPTALHDG